MFETATAFSAGSRYFRFIQNLLRGPPNPNFGLVTYRSSFWGVKRLGREDDYSPPSSAEVRNEWSCTHTPPIRLHGV